MNRRDFVSRVVLGGAAACTVVPRPSFASNPSASLTMRFVGMMGFIERTDRSFLVATPGEHHHMNHVPFMMARAGSRIARELGFQPVRGVVPEAFDTRLAGAKPEAFVYRSLHNTALDIVTGEDSAVLNQASELAQMNRIAPGKRIRGNVEKWASSTISLRGGRLDNSAAHPDAGRLWTFGNYRQKLTDAVDYSSAPSGPATIRVSSSHEARTITLAHGETEDLWIFSAAAMDARGGSPTRIEHSNLVFEYLVDAPTVMAECAEATGRVIPDTEIPFVGPTSAGAGVIGMRTSPPDTWLCWMALFGLGTTTTK